VTQGNGHVIDPSGDARRVLETAVAERGPGVLSDPATMDGICRARLQGMPGETILIGSAARSNVPALLQQQVGRLGLDAAIQDVAATVARTHQLDIDACMWVVREFARALGYPVPGLPPLASAGGFAGGSQLYPPTQASPSAYPPTPAPGYQQPYQQQQPYQPYQQTPPPLYPQGGTLPGRPPGGPWYSNRKILGVVAAAAVIVVYLGVAASAHLAPFGKPVAVVTHSPTPTPHPTPTFSMPTPSPTPDPSPDTSPDAVPTITSDEALWNLIPGNVRTSNCKAITPTDQATEEIACTDAIYNAQTEGGYLYYYLFPNSTTLDTSYTNNFLTPLSISSDEGNCGSFTAFKATCETGWNNTNPSINGRLAEYLYKGFNTLTWTEEQQHIMVYLSGVNGTQMLNWWLYPDKWVVTGS
jgi:hypothetical protein